MLIRTMEMTRAEAEVEFDEMYARTASDLIEAANEIAFNLLMEELGER